MRIAIHQCGGQMGAVEANLDLLAASAEQAAAHDARLLILPELFLSGYNIGERIWQLALPAPTANGCGAMRRAADIAQQFGVALLFGYPEWVGDQVYNAACLIERDGRAIANHRKLQLYGDDEKHLFVPGESLARAELDGLTIGLLICYDVEFPELVRAHALAGVDLVAVPTALMEPQDFVATTMVPTRAFENGCFVAYVNRCGEENGLRYCGRSCVIAPDGSELARAGSGEEWLLADLDQKAYDDWRRLIPYLEDRRTELLP